MNIKPYDFKTLTVPFNRDSFLTELPDDMWCEKMKEKFDFILTEVKSQNEKEKAKQGLKSLLSNVRAAEKENVNPSHALLLYRGSAKKIFPRNDRQQSSSVQIKNLIQEIKSQSHMQK